MPSDCAVTARPTGSHPASGLAGRLRKDRARPARLAPYQRSRPAGWRISQQHSSPATSVGLALRLGPSLIKTFRPARAGQNRARALEDTQEKVSLRCYLDPVPISDHNAPLRPDTRRSESVGTLGVSVTGTF